MTTNIRIRDVIRKLSASTFPKTPLNKTQPEVIIECLTTVLKSLRLSRLETICIELAVSLIDSSRFRSKPSGCVCVAVIQHIYRHVLMETCDLKLEDSLGSRALASATEKLTMTLGAFKKYTMKRLTRPELREVHLDRLGITDPRDRTIMHERTELERARLGAECKEKTLVASVAHNNLHLLTNTDFGPHSAFYLLDCPGSSAVRDICNPGAAATPPPAPKQFYVFMRQYTLPR